MISKPKFFNQIRENAAKRWAQLDRDPELAGPWHQLFSQVQSPRHVVSELLQNADDAGATEASVVIENGEFIFTHNGEDFKEEHFASLCRFGYSNKRSLHTIGFRGIGFKSTFSLGDEVKLLTPTLAVLFNSEHFTEPKWINSARDFPKLTEVHVLIKDEFRVNELEKNLEEWLNSPSSLLFFTNIRTLRICDKEVSWVSNGVGPVNNSKWMVLSSKPENRYLHIQSEFEEFPNDCLEEIKKERMIKSDELSFPPCRVEIVLGFDGRLFVILPTGVKSDLPFACNAPFIQDPAREKIKDPGISQTNRWLLQRTGNLAANTMISWLNADSLSIEERCMAYQLLTDVDREDKSLEGACATIIELAIDSCIREEKILLSEKETLELWKICYSIPSQLFDIWSSEQISSYILGKNKPILSRFVSSKSIKKLTNWGCLQFLSKNEIISTLKIRRLPKPISWKQLLNLWDYLSDDLTAYSSRPQLDIKIMPVQGKTVLYAANEIVRLGEKQLLKSVEDWHFLAEYLLVLNQNWPRFLSEQKRQSDEDSNEKLATQVEKSYRILRSYGLNDTSSTSLLINRVADTLFNKTESTVEDFIRIAQIAAQLGVYANDSFKYITHDGNVKNVREGIFADVSNDLDYYVENSWYQTHVINTQYADFRSCTSDEWEQWINSGKSRLYTFFPICQTKHNIYGRTTLTKFLKERCYGREPDYSYVTHDFTVEDWDFLEIHWQCWDSRAKADDSFWGNLLTRILKQPSIYWSNAKTSRIQQISTSKSTNTIINDSVLPNWIMRLRKLQCLQDTYGIYQYPTELLRRNASTESLLGLEPFVRIEFDNETTLPLLILLGVRDTPTGPERLLEQIKILTTVDIPPLSEIQRWYFRLDQFINNCSTRDFEFIKSEFSQNKIILTDDTEWASTPEVFLCADEEEFPGITLVHSSVRSLTLWRKIGIEDQPTPELTIKWLMGLNSGQILSKIELKRVRSILPKYPERIWDECGHWLNLEEEWAPVEQLTYSLGMQSLVSWKHLFKSAKQKTADLQKLSASVCNQLPFSRLSSLAMVIDDKFHDEVRNLSNPITKEWLVTLGSILTRIILENQEDTDRIRKLSQRLTNTQLRFAPEIKTVPYIDNIPAGTSRRVDCLWKDEVIYAQNRSAAQLAVTVAHEIGRQFSKQEIEDAIKLCYERSSDFIIEYIEENFTLVSEKEFKLNSENIQPEDMANETSKNKESANNASSFKENTDVHDTEESVPQSETTSNEDYDENYEESDPTNKKSSESDDVKQKQEAPKHSQSNVPSLIERFTKYKGYINDGSDRFYNSDGGWIMKVSNIFNWERYSPIGELLECYWLRDHCLQQEPIQIDAEVVNLCKDYPNKYTLILVDIDGSPIEITGRQLIEMLDNSKMSIYPAKYRLVMSE